MTRRVYPGALVCVLLVLGACVGPRGRAPEPPPAFHIGSLGNSGDPARRASNRLIAEGLDNDAVGRPAVALGLYERSLQVDPTNPYAFLALARHHAEGLDPERAFAFLDKAEALLDHERAAPPGVEAHLVGLRGAALYAGGRFEAGTALLERARALAPEAWSDGHLTARELR